MTVILSPAMNMRQVHRPDLPLSRPVFLEDAARLASRLAGFSPWELESLLGVNEALSFKAWEYYRDFDPQEKGHGAVLSFYGLAYQNLQPEDFTPSEMDYATGHLRLLSSLYGLLRPLDGIQPYRLDFMCRFAKQKTDGKNLYQYWGERVCRALYDETDTVVNLCSGEYTKLAARGTIPGRFVGCRFLVNKGGKLRCQATASKMARGQMARYIIKNKIDAPEDLAGFQWDGYEYAPHLSGPDQMTFVRNENAQL